MTITINIPNQQTPRVFNMICAEGGLDPANYPTVADKDRCITDWIREYIRHKTRQYEVKTQAAAAAAAVTDVTIS